MKYRFNRAGNTVTMQVRIVGPTGFTVGQCALDTGASRTLLTPRILAVVGIDSSLGRRTPILGVGGVSFARETGVVAIGALGLERQGFTVLAFSLPPQSQLDGLLGLDFFRGTALTIDFANGFIQLNR